jgi:pimeloyl-ACP methyl ester carboxylesterase
MYLETKQDAQVTHFPGIVCKAHYFDVPLDYQKPSGQRIVVFAREVVSLENKDKPDLPWLVFLQGGPGFQSPRPESANGWLKTALKQYRVLLLDQRGTGLSSPVTHETLGVLGSNKQQFEYLKHFRADSIVSDCEFIRQSLAGGRPWTVLGQSYGGFCLTTYLSFAPQGLAGAILTGGLPPLVDQPDDVYRATYRQVIANNRRFYERFPEDIDKVKRIVEHLQTNQVFLPSGEILSARRFLQLGLIFGFKSSGSSMNTVHYLLERAFVPGIEQETLSYYFLHEVQKYSDFNTNPIYALLHESIYCQNQASNWSAQRIMAEFPEFNLDSNAVYFTGEMIYPWMFDDYACLQPLKAVANELAEYSAWPKLYDAAVLQQNTVACVAAIYYNDMYVDKSYSEQTAKQIRGLKVWITNEYEHDGLRDDGQKVLGHLLEMLQDPAS